jgi:LmbE family N-acetylglucosaminyl deacetylase
MTMYAKIILSIHAHPDDTEIFCSGTLALLSNLGYRIKIIALTNGNLGGIGTSKKNTAQIRKKEAMMSAGMIGAEYDCIGADDGFLFDSKAVRSRVIEAIRKAGAGIILTHLPNDYHSDHRATSNITEISAMLVTLPNAGRSKPLDSTPLLYHTSPLKNCDNLGNPVPKPHFIVDITSVIGIKKKMIDCHVSQREVMKKMHKMENFTEEMLSQSRFTGNLAGIEYGESFWQHTGGSFSEVQQLQSDLREFIRTI